MLPMEGRAGIEPASFRCAADVLTKDTSRPYTEPVTRLRGSCALRTTAGLFSCEGTVPPGDQRRHLLPKEAIKAAPMGCRVLCHAAQRHPLRRSFLFGHSGQGDLHSVFVRQNFGHDLHHFVYVEHNEPPFSKPARSGQRGNGTHFSRGNGCRAGYS